MTALADPPITLQARTATVRAPFVVTTTHHRLLGRVGVAVWLAVFAVIASTVSITVAGGMSAFEDEGLYLFIGHREIAHMLHGTRVVEHPGAFLSGAPWFYPTLAAMADHVGGLAAARVLSLAFVLVAGLAVFALTSELYGRRAGLIANAAFLLNGSVLFVSHLATFDSLTMMLVAIAAWLTVRSGRDRLMVTAPVIALVLMLAFFAKYAALVFLPVIALLLAVQGGRRSAYIGLRRAAYVVVAFVFATYFVIQLFSREIIIGIRSTTLSRSAMHVESYTALTALVLLWVGPWLAAAAVSFLGSHRSTWAMRAALLVGAVAAPLAQIRTHEETSLSKHVAFGMIFAAPLIGDLVHRMLVMTRYKALPTAMTVLAIFAWCGVHFSGQFLTSWVDDKPLVPVLQHALAAAPTKAVLGEQGSSERYALQKQLFPAQWCDTYSFGYDGKSGPPAYAEAIQQSHFGVIYLTLTTPNGHWLQQYLSTTPTPYILSAKVPRYFRGQVVGDWLVYTPRVSL